MQGTTSSIARRASLSVAVPPAADSSGQPDGASASSGVASASASTSRSVATGSPEVASRSVVALSSGVAPPSAPAASTTRTEVDSPRPQSVARDRKVEQVDPGVTLSPPAKVVDAKHAAVAVQAIALSPASHRALGVLAQALDDFMGCYSIVGLAQKTSPEYMAAQAALKQAATAFQDSIDSRSSRQVALADAIFKLLVVGLRHGKIHVPLAMPRIARDTSLSLALTDALIDRLTPAVAQALQSLWKRGDREYETNIFLGLVDASMTLDLGASFTTHDHSEDTLARLSHLAYLSVERPALAPALAEARFSRQATTRDLGHGMDRLGQMIVKRAAVADAVALGLVAMKLVAQIEMSIARKDGRAWLKYALEPYFRGSLANRDLRAPAAVIRGVLTGIDRGRMEQEIRQSTVSSLATDPDNRLNLDDMATTFMQWASEAPHRRQMVSNALGLALHNFGNCLPPGPDVDGIPWAEGE